MSKSFRHYKKSLKQKRKKLNRKTTIRNRKLRNSNRKFRNSNRKLTGRNFRGGNGEKVQCCMCERIVFLKITFVPRECLMKYGKAAHRICEDCWWDPNNGFALETSSHECPGCIKGLLLTQFEIVQPILVDLTED
jgi:hypothetical protein